MFLLREGIYEEIINRKLKKQLDSLDESKILIKKDKLDVEEARKILSTYISIVTRRALRFVRDQESDNKNALLKQIKTCNSIIDTLSKELNDEEFKALQIDEQAEVLHAVYNKLNSIHSIRNAEIVRPTTSIAESSLFTGARHEPSMMHELQKEILSSDEVNFLVSFIKWSGIRCIYEELKAFTENGGKLRIITTTYMEATDYKAIRELLKLPNTSIKISYDVKRTRLHAKAYLFKRETGFTTAYIGSSNLSHSAINTGLEWNIKVTEKESFDIIKKFEATFDTYWNDPEFQLIHPKSEEHHIKLKQALEKNEVKESSEIYATFDIRPYHYQQEMLDQLQVEREVFGRYKNLLVAATGVGKTVISAFDYKRFKNNTQRARLLFVAHREEILRQSLDTFRVILKDFNFGDLLVGGHKPRSLEHLFISIQSFNSIKLYEKVSADFYDFIIVDEFHHAAASSYQTLLNYFKPKILLGLTATPERMDGQDITHYFDGQIASEMRLPEAINRNLLSPFQYFCVTDTVDLSKLKWSRKGYETNELENVYTHNTIRSKQILNSVYKYVNDIEEVKGLGFCVSVPHAEYMAQFFNREGVPSIALHGKSDSNLRRKAHEKLEKGEIKFIFTVDIYNEGVDIPCVNTILFLRPTESLTIFLQQLGRGLRLYDGKDCLTVLDFVGRVHKDYNFFEKKFRALIGRTKYSIKHYVENGFSTLPRGCFIRLEKQAKEYVLETLSAHKNTKSQIINKLKEFVQDSSLNLTLDNFLSYYDLSLCDFYGKNRNRLFQRLLVEADLAPEFYCEHEDLITRRIHKLFHVKSKKFLDFIINYVEKEGDVALLSEEEKLMENMLYYSFFQDIPKKEGFRSIREALKALFITPQMKTEILEVCRYNRERINTLEKEHSFNFPLPLSVHSEYTKEQILAAFGYFNENRCPAFREGVKYFEDKKVDIFFITINKSEKDFSPSTLYEDYAINDELFHWQSQSTTSVTSPTGRRYINHKEMGTKIALFVREYSKTNGYTAPFMFLGTCQYVSHHGDKPISFIWRLDEKMPPGLFEQLNKVVV